MKKLTLMVTVKLVVHADEDVSPSHVMEEVDYSFADTTGKADIVDTEITHWEVQ